MYACKVVGFDYVPGRRPRNVFDGPPHLHVESERTLRISKLTHVPDAVMARFETSLQKITQKYSDVFVAEPTPQINAPDTASAHASMFGPATPAHVRDVLRKDPQLHCQLNASLASEFGWVPDCNGMPDMEILSRVQTIINSPSDGGMLTGEEFQALLDQGYA